MNEQYVQYVGLSIIAWLFGGVIYIIVGGMLKGRRGDLFADLTAGYRRGRPTASSRRDEQKDTES